MWRCGTPWGALGRSGALWGDLGLPEKERLSKTSYRTPSKRPCGALLELRVRGGPLRIESPPILPQPSVQRLIAKCTHIAAAVCPKF